MIGNKVYEQDQSNFTGAFSQEISTTLAAGIYEMKIFHGSDTYLYKIVIKH